MLGYLARLGSSYPRRVLVVTFVFLVVAGVIGGPVASLMNPSGGFVPAKAESIAAVQRIAQASGVHADGSIILIVAAPRGAVGDGRVREVAGRLGRIDGVTNIAFPSGRSRDRKATLITADIGADFDSNDVGEEVIDRFKAMRDVSVGGRAIGVVQVSERVRSDLTRAELIAMPLLVLLSLLFFRGRRAALMPVLVGGTTVLGSFLVLRLVNEVYYLSIFALNLVVGLGLGLAIDYTLLLVTRFREEVAAGAEPNAAIHTTLTVSGRAVIFSAVTVAAALVALTLFPLGFLTSMGISGAIVALVAAFAALAISPALLGLWGLKLVRRPDTADRAGGWYRFTAWVIRHPGRIAMTTAIVMVAVAAPALTASWAPIDNRSIPKSESTRQVSDRLERDFAAAGQTTIPVAINAPAGERAGVVTYANKVRAVKGVDAVAPPVYLGRSTWQLPVGIDRQRVEQDVAAGIRAVPTELKREVGGRGAEFIDQQAAIGERLPLAILIIAILTFTVLWMMTGSVILPIKAIIMNVLTVGVSLSPLVLIYQHGNLTGLLNYTPNGGIEATDFLVAATLVFALSTDYGVLLLSRIKEARDSGLGERDAVATGLAKIGSVVSAAAILLAVAIGVFSTSSISFIQQIGVAGATGVLIDAFVVRTLLVPSLMALLGRWNWWSPKPLRKLHARIPALE